MFMRYCSNILFIYYCSGFITGLTKPADFKTFGSLMFLVPIDEKGSLCVQKTAEWFKVVSCLCCHTKLFVIGV